MVPPDPSIAIYPTDCHPACHLASTMIELHTPTLNPADDWRGVASSAVRKKLQNRLNQRARRRRRMQRYELSVLYLGGVDGVELGSIRQGNQRWWFHTTEAVIEEDQDICAGVYSNTPPLISGLDVNPGCLLTRPETSAMLQQFAQDAHINHSLHAPRPSQLPVLIRLNVLNALSRNAVLLGFQPRGLCEENSVSPFDIPGPGFYVPPPSCPESLWPRPAQRNLPHHPWIDLFPIPDLRENFLVAVESGLVDDDDLCMDLLEVGCGEEKDKPALIVWGTPWDPQAWEASLPFLRKWGWLLRGCFDLLEATNYWREKRGEKRLDFGGLLGGRCSSPCLVEVGSVSS